MTAVRKSGKEIGPGNLIEMKVGFGEGLRTLLYLLFKRLV
jgi:hypothetical protein